MKSRVHHVKSPPAFGIFTWIVQVQQPSTPHALETNQHAMPNQTMVFFSPVAVGPPPGREDLLHMSINQMMPNAPKSFENKALP